MAEEYTTKYIFELEIKGQEMVKQAEKVWQDVTKALRGGTVEVQKQTAAYATLEQSVQKTAKTTQNLGQTMSAYLMKPTGMIRQVGTEMAGLSNATADYMLTQRQATTDAKHWINQLREGITEQTRLEWAIRRTGYGIEALGRSMIRQGAVSLAAVYAVTKMYWNFNEAVTRASMAMELQAGLQGELAEALLKTSVELAKFTPAELAEGVRLWAAGTGEAVKSQMQLNRVIEDTVDIQKLATLNNVNFSETVTTVGGIMAEYALGVEDVNRVTSVLNYAAAKSFANVGDLGDAFKMVGPIANQLGITLEQTAAAMMMLSDQNIRGTMAGRGLRQMLTQLAKPTAAMNKEMNKLAGYSEDAGDAWKEIVWPGGQFMGLGEYIKFLAEATRNYTQEQKQAALAVTARISALSSLNALVAEEAKWMEYNIDVISVYEKVINGVMDAEVLRFKMLYENLEGLPFTTESAIAKMSNQWEEYTKSPGFAAMKAKATWEAAFIRMGESLSKSVLPQLETFVDLISKAADAMQGTDSAAKALIISFETLLALGLALQTLGWGIKSYSNLKTIIVPLQNLMASNAIGLSPATAGMGLTTASLVSVLIPATVAVLGAGAVIAALGALGEKLYGKIGEGMEREMATRAKDVQEAFARQFNLNRPSLRPFRGMYSQSWADVSRPTGSMTGKLQDIGRWFEFAFGVKLDIKSVADLKRELDRIAEEERVVRINVELEGETDLLRGHNLQMAMQRAVDEAAAEVTPMPEELRAFGEAALPVLMQLEQLERDHTQNLSDITDDYYAQRHDTAISNGAALLDLHLNYDAATEDRAQTHFDRLADMEDDYNRSAARSYQDHLRSMASSQADYDRSNARAYAEHDRSLAKAEASYRLTEQRAEEDYKARLEELRRRYDEQEIKDAEDHQDKLADLAKDHGDRMVDLLETRDVRGLTKEIRDYQDRVEEEKSQYAESRQDAKEAYDKQVADEKEAYREEKARRKEDYQLRIAEMQEQFARERALAAEDFARRQMEAEEQYQRQAAQRLEDHNRQVDEENANFTAEQSAADAQYRILYAKQIAHGNAAKKQDKDNFDERMKQEGENYEEQRDSLLLQLGFIRAQYEGLDEDLYTEIYPQIFDHTEEFLDDLVELWKEKTRSVVGFAAQVAAATGSIPTIGASGLPEPTPEESLSGMQTGGYAYAGMYRLGEAGREFVLNWPTTNLLEQRLGPLTQQKLLGSRGGVTIDFRPQFNGMGETDKGWYLQAAWEQAQEVVRQTIRGVR